MVREFYLGVLCYCLIAALPWFSEQFGNPRPVVVEIAELNTLVNHAGLISNTLGPPLITTRIKTELPIVRPRPPQ